MSKGQPGEPNNEADSDEEIIRRLVSLERSLTQLQSEVRTKRIVVIDEDGIERIVGEAPGGVAELRVEASGNKAGSSCALVLFATEGGITPEEGDGDPNAGLGQALGMQLWVNGNAVVEIGVSWDDDGQWRPTILLNQSPDY